jgi:hypothetical protein
MNRIAMFLGLLSSTAFAVGPVVEGSAMVASAPLTQNARLWGGYQASLGVEFGDVFNHELALEFVALEGIGEPAAAQGLGGRYTFSVDFLGKKGFTPTVGIGVSAGRFLASSPGDNVGGFYLSARALAGVRYTFDFGLSLKALLVGNLYGPTVSFAPTLGIAWRF